MAAQLSARNEADPASLPAAESPPGKPTPPSGRIWYLDHLRVVLTLQVVLHHLVLIILLAHPGTTGPVGQLAGSLLLTFNQAFFMGLFFLLAGYFVPSALERKGARRFLTDRALRLLIPLLAYAFILGQLMPIENYLVKGEPFTWNTYVANIDKGPMWFVLVLMIFVVGYVGWHALTTRRRQRSNRSTSSVNTLESQRPLPGFWAITGFTGAMALAFFLIRLGIPMTGAPDSLGQPVVRAISSFFTPSGHDLPQYVALFVIGILAYRHDWLRRMPGRAGVFGLIAAAVATVLLYPVAVATGMAGSRFTGGPNWQSAVYSLWQAIFCVGICLALLVFFRRYVAKTNRLWQFLAGNAYTVYLLHMPAIAVLVTLLTVAAVPPAWWFTVGVIVIVPLCFLAAAAIRAIPGTKRIL